MTFVRKLNSSQDMKDLVAQVNEVMYKVWESQINQPGYLIGTRIKRRQSAYIGTQVCIPKDFSNSQYLERELLKVLESTQLMEVPNHIQLTRGMFWYFNNGREESALFCLGVSGPQNAKPYSVTEILCAGHNILMPGN